MSGYWTSVRGDSISWARVLKLLVCPVPTMAGGPERSPHARLAARRRAVRLACCTPTRHTHPQGRRRPGAAGEEATAGGGDPRRGAAGAPAAGGSEPLLTFSNFCVKVYEKDV